MTDLDRFEAMLEALGIEYEIYPVEPIEDEDSTDLTGFDAAHAVGAVEAREVGSTWFCFDTSGRYVGLFDDECGDWRART